MKNKDVIRLAERLILLDESNQKLLAETFFTGLGEEELLNWLSWLGGFVSPRSRWIEIEQWMESRFETNFSWTPRKMALICKKYLKMDPRMFPFLVKTAQRVKHWVMMRKRSQNAFQNRVESSSALEGSAKHSDPAEDGQ